MKIKGYMIVGEDNSLGYEGYTYFTTDKELADELLSEVVDDCPDLKVIDVTVIPASSVDAVRTAGAFAIIETNYDVINAVCDTDGETIKFESYDEAQKWAEENCAFNYVIIPLF